MQLEDIKKGELVSFNNGTWKIEDVEFGLGDRLVLLCSPQSSKCNWPHEDELKSIPAIKAELA